MASPDDQLQDWFSGLSYKTKRKLAGDLKDITGSAAVQIQAAAPELSGKLKGTVKVRRKRNDLDLEITAGGPETTKEIRAGSGVEYDYALAGEYGTVNEEAQPWFFPTWRQIQGDVRQEIEDAVNDAIDNG